MLLEKKLQPQLNRTVPAGPEDWIASCCVGRGTTTTEGAWRRWIVMAKAIRSAVRVRKIGMVKHVEKFGPKLSGEAFLELPAFGKGQIPVAEAGVAKGVPAHRTEGSGRRWNHDRIPLGKAAKGIERRSRRAVIDPAVHFHGRGLASAKEGIGLCRGEHDRATGSILNAATQTTARAKRN